MLKCGRHFNFFQASEYEKISESRKYLFFETLISNLFNRKIIMEQTDKRNIYQYAYGTKTTNY